MSSLRDQNSCALANRISQMRKATIQQCCPHMTTVTQCTGYSWVYLISLNKSKFVKLNVKF